jgi:hypothetical protein
MKLSDGRTLIVYKSVILADTVHGYAAVGRQSPVAVPVRDIQTIEVERFSAGKTLGMVVLVTLGCLAYFYATYNP